MKNTVPICGGISALITGKRPFANRQEGNCGGNYHYVGDTFSPLFSMVWISGNYLLRPRCFMNALSQVFSRRNRVYALTLACTVLAEFVMPPSIVRGSDVINSGTTAWVNAAKAGRADMLVLGDSTVLVNNDGWDAGLNIGLQNTVGLAGSGLQSGLGGEGEQYAIGPIFGSDLGNRGIPVPTGYDGYIWRGTYQTAGTIPAGALFAEIKSVATDTGQGDNWTFYTAAGPGGGSISGIGRYSDPSWTTFSTFGPVMLNNTGSGLQKTTIHFDKLPTANTSRELQVTGLTNAAIMYSRVTEPGATGATVSSWSLGGQGTKNFLQNQYLNGSMTAAGRQQLLNALVDGGSGKLNVAIAEGFNDRNNSGQMSADGVNNSSTPQGFAANISALISAVRNDWIAAGHSRSDLSFTLIGEYQDYYAANAPSDSLNLLKEYAAVEMQLAQADSQISFVDLYNDAPSYSQANALGYMADQVHFSRAGAINYGNLVANALVNTPEPTSLGLLGLLSLVGLASRRRR